MNELNSDIPIRDMVSLWWSDAVERGTQLGYPDAVHQNTVATGDNGSGWYSKIDTETLYNDFTMWAEEMSLPTVTKQAFMNVFYSVSGARRGRSRLNQRSRSKGAMAYVALFGGQSKESTLDTNDVT